MTPTWALVEDGRVRSIARTEQSPGKDWLPVDTVVPDHDPATHRPTGATFDVAADKVTATHEVIAIVVPDDPPSDEPAGEPQPDRTPTWLRRIEAVEARVEAAAALAEDASATAQEVATAMRDGARPLR